MSDHKPFAYYDTLHDKLLWAEGPQYVHAQRTEGMSLKPLYLHPPRPEPEAEPSCWVVESSNGWNTRSDEPPDSVKATCNCYPLYTHPPRPEPEAEPVCWICSKIDEHEKYKIEWEKDLLPYWIRRGWDVEPLYTRSEPARKPMNGDEVLEAFCKADISGLQSFTEGVRCAEEFHGIGGDDE